MLDSFGRNINKLRVSLGESCNMACTYCVSSIKDHRRSPYELSAVELLKLVSILVKYAGIEKVRLTGNKAKKKIYYKHTGYPGGLKETKFQDIISGKNPDFIIRKAVERMMNANALSKKQLGNLRIFKGNNHSLEAQKPEALDFASHNRKNFV